MKKNIKKLVALCLCVAMILSLNISAFALVEGFTDMFSFAGTPVTVDGTTDKQVRISLKSDSYTGGFYGIQCKFPMHDETGNLTLTDVNSAILPLTDGPGAYASMDNQTIYYADASFTYEIAAGAEVAYAIYTVNKDTPTGDYTVSINPILIDGDADSNKPVYTATISVTNTNCHHENAAKTEAVEAGCTTTGTEAYWTCPECGKLFSDAECTNVIKAPVSAPAQGHDYVDGVCTRCGAAQPTLELYIDVVPADRDANGYGEVTLGETFNAYLKVKSTDSFTLASLDARINYDTDHLTFISASSNIDTYGDGIHFQDYSVSVPVTADTETTLATLSFKVKQNVPNKTTMDISVDGENEIAKAGDIVFYNATTDGGDKGVEVSSATMTFVYENGTEDVVLEQAVGTAVTIPADDTKPGYDFVGWDGDGDGEADAVPTVMPAEDVLYNSVFKAQEHKLSFDPDNGEPETVVKGKTDEEINPADLPENPEKTGYDFGGWDADNDGTPDTLPENIPTEDVDYTAIWNAKTYTLTYEANGGDCTADTVNFTIETELTLADCTKDGNIFNGWKVTTAEGSWIADTTYDAMQALGTGNYGDVTLTAQWLVAANFRFEDYAYAKTTDVMLIVDAAKLESGAYLFDGQPLYWTDSTDYGTNGAYVTLVNVVDKDYLSMSQNELAALITVDADTDTVAVSYDGDVNGDGKTTTGDASLVYQMLTKNSDALSALTILDRLEADMSTATANATYRGSIADCEAIMAIVRK
ncbi:MAG: InlB B-repeat-containing protein [Oscillospiraceae bacterium]|nr:InlB B-repeat-containing protein [Oscillospiraceae bacterium]